MKVKGIVQQKERVWNELSMLVARNNTTFAIQFRQ